MQVSVISPSYSIPLQYNLFFNISSGPPSNVTCTILRNNTTRVIPDDQIVVETFDYEFMGQEFDLSIVTVKMSGRITGEVVCTVSIILLDKGNLETRTNTSSVNLNGNLSCYHLCLISVCYIVTETPVETNATRTDKPMDNIIYWSLPTLGPANLIYEVFYNSSENSSLIMAGRNETPSINLPNLDLQIEYGILVIGINEFSPSTLPSYPINIPLPDRKYLLIVRNKCTCT